jgi:hypothetical protein
MVYIDKIGLCQLAIRSHLRKAEAFKEWVVADVLPSLRKDGTYSLSSQQVAPRSFPALETLRLDATVFLDETKRHLYVISTDSELAKGNLKIGVAGDVPERIAQFQTAQNDLIRLLLVFLHAEKLEANVLKRLPLSGTGGTEWRAASVDQVKQAVTEVYDEMKALSGLPAPPALSLKRKREDPLETRQQDMDLQMQLEHHQDERKIKMDKHQCEMDERKIKRQCEMDKHQCEMDERKIKRQCEMDKHSLACERERLEIRQKAIEIRKQEVALGM